VIERIVIVAAFAAIVAAVFAAGRWAALRRSRRAALDHGWDDADFSDSKVTVVLFTGPRCAQCVTQRSVIEAARAARGNVGFAEFNAGVKPDLARRLAVLSVPTTVIVDSSGEVVFRNGRLVGADVLSRQLDKALALSG